MVPRPAIFLPFAMGYFLSYLYRTINAVLGPDISAELGLDSSQLGLLTAAYFCAFAVAQLPLGLLLDRYGPRRVEAALLVVAAIGALVFARATTLTGLVLGRGLIGLGVSACLMAAFKAFVIWFPREQLPRINGYQMAAGSLGALAATAPVEAALVLTDWRGMFILLAAITLAVAAAIFLLVPEQQPANRDTGLGEQLRGLKSVLTSRVFWQVAPWATFSQATFLSIQGLWAGPWLRDVSGRDRPAVAATLLVLACAMVAGHIVLGTVAERLSRHGIRPLHVAGGGMTVFMVVLLFPVFQWPVPPVLFWMIFGFSGTSAIITYAVLSQSFPGALAGRVNTALNLMVFVAAFGAQWGTGAIINRWPTMPNGGYAPDGYPVAFGILFLLQFIGILAYFWVGWGLRRNAGSA
jgi:predicted MFS family arabinose efflux permease